MRASDDFDTLTEKDVMRALKIGSRETIARMVRKGQLPKPMIIGGGRKRWPKAGFATWYESHNA